MYFHIDKIRGITLNRIPESDIERRDSLKKFMLPANLISLNIFSKIYTHNSSLYIDLEAFNLFINELYDRFKINKKIGSYSKCKVTEVDGFFEVKSLNDLRNLEKMRDAACAVNNRKKYDLIDKLNQPLPTDIIDKKLMALDFEFESIGKHFKLLEMGISIQENNQKQSFNYSFRDKSSEKFNYGETSYVDKETVLAIFKEHFMDCDYLVGHNLNNELLILKQLGIEETFFENTKFIDTAYVSQNEFHFLNSDHVINATASLRTALRTFDIPYVRLHVAGNDASYTLDVLNQMVFHKIKSHSKKDHQKIKIVNHFKSC